jgi:hypothetical protein
LARAPVLALSLLVTVACGGQQAGGPPKGTVSSAPAPTNVDPETAGRISGRAVLKGVAPKNALIDMKSDPACLREATARPTEDEAFLIGQGGVIQNVFVYVKSGLDGLAFDAPAEAVVLEQRGCRYHPHVFGVRIGQPLEILNSDDTLHNARSIATLNQEFNVGEPARGSKTIRRFTAREVMVSFKCDVHAWMRAYAGVLDHPYFAVTGIDGGFELNNVPPGSYVIEAWHERMGTETVQVTLGPRGSQEISFVFKAIPPTSPAGPDS